MAKSPLAKNSKAAKHVRNSRDVIPLRLTIPYKDTKNRSIPEFDISHLLHLGTNRNNDKIENRAPYLRNFCKKAKQYVGNGKSAKTATVHYENLRSFIAYCDAVKVNPFSEAGYLKFSGNDGELRHRIRMYHTSKNYGKGRTGKKLVSRSQPQQPSLHNFVLHSNGAAYLLTHGQSYIEAFPVKKHHSKAILILKKKFLSLA